MLVERASNGPADATAGASGAPDAAKAGDTATTAMIRASRYNTRLATEEPERTAVAIGVFKGD